MYLEAKETAKLYKLLTEKLGNDTTEAVFKYIDNKTERSVEATIKTLATKDDLAKAIAGVKDDLANVKDSIADVKYDLSNRIANSVRWSFIFWIGQAATTIGTLWLILKK